MIIGILEGVNGMVQAAKRKIRGNHSTDNFMEIIYAKGNKNEFNL